MKKLVISLVVLGIGAWIIFKLMPSDEQAIRKLLGRLVEAASIKPGESGLARLAYADRLAGFFTTNVFMQLEGFGTEFTTVNNRTEFTQAAMAARMQLRQAEFKLAEVDVRFPTNRAAASVYAVITGQINLETNRFAEPLKLTFVRSTGRWLISEVHSVPTVQ